MCFLWIIFMLMLLLLSYLFLDYLCLCFLLFRLLCYFFMLLVCRFLFFFFSFFFFLMIRLPPSSTRTATLFPYTTLFRSTGTSSSRSCSSSLSSLAGGDRAEAHAVGVARNDDAIAAGHVHRAGMDGAALLADLVGGNIDIGGAEIELPTRRLAGLRGGHRRADRRARGDDEDVIAHLAHRHPVGKGPAEHRRVEGMRAFLVGRRQLVPVALAHAVAAERGAVLVARAEHHVEGIAQIGRAHV